MIATRKRHKAAWSISTAWMLITTAATAADNPAPNAQFSPNTLEDWVTTIGTLITIALAIWGLWSGLSAARSAIKEKRKEHRQKQLTAAREMMKEIFDDPLARSAMRMMDWSGRSFIHQNQTYVVHWKDLKPALVVHQKGQGFTKQQEFIRDCFEAFFDHMLVLEHFLEQDYLHESDIAVPLEYYAERVMSFPETYDGFLQAYGYHDASELMRRLAKRQQ